MATAFRAPKPWHLTEKETFSSFASWQSNVKYYLSTNDEFAPYLSAQWQKSSTANRGFADDPADQANRKTAVQKVFILERMLGIIAQYAPSYLRTEITTKSTSLASVWKSIRKYYSLQKSEINFLKISRIHREEEERYETLFQRILAHLEDNLITVESGIIHDGAAPTEDEVLSPTAERLAVYIWMTLIDQRLPDFVARQYAHDLQTKSIKEIQPLIVDNMESLLAGINAEENIQISYTSASRSKRYQSNTPFKSNSRGQGGSSMKPSVKPKKVCILCKAAGRNYEGHDLSACWHLSKIDKLEISKALKVEIEEEEASDDNGEDILTSVVEEPQNVPTDHVINRVKTSKSPIIYMYYEEHTSKCLVDTGGTSSLITRRFTRIAGIKVDSTTQRATQLDKTAVPVLGEVHIELTYGDLVLPLDALVVEVMDCDILLGVPFCEENDVSVHLKKRIVDIQGRRISYGGPSRSDGRSSILRNTTSTVVYPGEFLELKCENAEEIKDGEEVTVEPHIDSPQNGNWPAPLVSRVVDNTVRIPNRSDSIVKLSKSQHVAVIRRLVTPDTVPSKNNPTFTPALVRIAKIPDSNLHSSFVSLDPSNQLMLTLDQ